VPCLVTSLRAARDEDGFAGAGSDAVIRAVDVCGHASTASVRPDKAIR